MASQKSTVDAKAPQRRRGIERVASLLDAATACFVDKGYEAATMTEIAARAGASIGSLYQFFPTKEALAHALMTQYTQALQQQLSQLAMQADGWNDDQLGTQLIRLLVTFRRRHPAFAVLAESVAALAAVRGLAIRQHLREGLQQLLARRVTHLSSSALRAAAVVVLQLMKAAVALSAEVGLSGRKAALDQLERALQLYLASLTKR
jgi:AcrR family transcriptional regulator